MSSCKRKESNSSFAFLRPKPDSESMFQSLFVPFFVTLGVGKIPWAPGTWGSLLGLLIWWALAPLSWPVGLGLIVVVTVLSWWLVTLYEAHQSRHDPKEVIIDEVLGIWVTLLALPLTPMTMFIGFLLFRFFDILKPYPISFIDRRVPGALGTLCDDLVAGLLARLILGYLVSQEFPWMM